MAYWAVSTEFTVSLIIFPLLWPFFFHLFCAHFRIPRINHLEHMKVGMLKDI
jgi:hypothetical protein